MEHISDLITNAIRGGLPERLSGQIGESPVATRRGVEQAIPISIAGLAAHASSEAKAESLLGMLRGGNYPRVDAMQLAETVKNPEATAQLASSGTGFLTQIFGDKVGSIVDMLAGKSGVSKRSAATLLGLSAPMVLHAVGKETNARNLDARGLSRFLADEGSRVQGALPSQLTGMIGAGAAAGARREPFTQQVRSGIDDYRRRHTHEGGAVAGRQETAGSVERRPPEHKKRRWPLIAAALALLVLLGLLLARRGRAPETAEGIRDTAGEAVSGAERAADTAARKAEGAADEARQAADRAMREGEQAARSAGDEAEQAAGKVTREGEQTAGTATREGGQAARGATGETRQAAGEAQQAASEAQQAAGEAQQAGETQQAAGEAQQPGEAQQQQAAGEAQQPGAVQQQQAAGEAQQPDEAAGEVERVAGGRTPPAQGGAAQQAGATMALAGAAGALDSFLASDAQTPQRFTLTDVQFDPASANLESSPMLDQVATVLDRHESARVRIEGHTDATGDPQQNLALARQRAAAVKNYLVERGIAPNRIETAGRGAGQPVAPNETEQGRAENRRVDLIVLER